MGYTMVMLPKVLAFSSLLIIGVGIGSLATLTTPARHLQVIEPSVQNIEAQQFWTLYEQNPENYLFIDVRDAATYAEGHPKGSVNIPLARLYTEREKLPKSGKKIVLICGGNAASGVAYSYLEHFGFFNLERIPGGYRDWLVAGLPTETGTSTATY